MKFLTVILMSVDQFLVNQFVLEYESDLFVNYIEQVARAIVPRDLRYVYAVFFDISKNLLYGL